MLIEVNRMVIERNRTFLGNRINRINREKDVKLRLPFDCRKQSKTNRTIKGSLTNRF